MEFYYRIYYEVVYPDGRRLLRNESVAQGEPLTDASIYKRDLERQFPGAKIVLKGFGSLSDGEIIDEFGVFFQ